MSLAAVSLAGTPNEDTAAAAISIGPSVDTEATTARTEEQDGATALASTAAEAAKESSGDGRNEASMPLDPRATFLTGVGLATAEE